MSRSAEASTTGATSRMPAKAPTTARAITYGTNGVRRIETMRRERTNDRAESKNAYAAFGIRVSSSSVAACGNTSGGIST